MCSEALCSEELSLINLITKNVTWTLLYARKSFSSFSKGCNLLSSRSLFSSRWSANRELGLAKALSLNALMRLWSITNSWRTTKLSSPSTWLISFPKKDKSWYVKWAQASWIKAYLSSFKKFLSNDFLKGRELKRKYFQGETEM